MTPLELIENDNIDTITFMSKEEAELIVNDKLVNWWKPYASTLMNSLFINALQFPPSCSGCGCCSPPA